MQILAGILLYLCIGIVCCIIKTSKGEDEPHGLYDNFDYGAYTILWGVGAIGFVVKYICNNIPKAGDKDGSFM